MESMYGGRPGSTFIIKKPFSSIAEMKEAFSQGDGYTDCWYGEYCLINCNNKNDKDNGKVFQRTLDYTDTITGGADLIGQIVGPSSGTPYFQVDSIENIVNLAKSTVANEETKYKRYPVGYDATKKKFITNKDKEATTTEPYIKHTNKIIDLIKGKEEGIDKDGKKIDIFHDDIEYTWLNVRSDNADADSIFYVGLKLPYLVTDYIANSVSPYNKDGSLNANRNAGTKKLAASDNQEHPFYSKWQIDVPKGIKGDVSNNIRVITPKSQVIDGKTIWYEGPGNFSENKIIYNLTALNRQADGTFKLKISKTLADGVTPDLSYQPYYIPTDTKKESNFQILVFNYYVYDEQQSPVPYIFYLSDYNMVSAVNVDEYGTLTFSYTHNKDTSFKEKIKWLDNVTLNTGDGNAGGVFNFTYNIHDKTDPTKIMQQSFKTSWIKNLDVKQDGSIVYTYVGDGKPDDEKAIPVEKNNVAVPGKYILNKKLKWVDQVALSPTTGILTVTNNQGEKTEQITKLPFISSLELSGKIEDSKALKIKYTNKDNIENVPGGATLNVIQDVSVDPNNWHLYVLFTEPTKRYPYGRTIVSNAYYNSLGETERNGYIPELVNGKDMYNCYWKKDINATYSTKDGLYKYDKSYGADIYWRDFGAIKDQSGVLIGFNIDQSIIDNHFSPDSPAGSKGPIDYLKSKYPNGLVGLAGDGNALSQNILHKIVTYSATPTDQKEESKQFYAYDYGSPGNTAKGWYYLGSLTDSGSRDATLEYDVDPLMNQEVLNTIKNRVSSNGLIFNINSFENKADEPFRQVWTPVPDPQPEPSIPEPAPSLPEEPPTPETPVTPTEPEVAESGI